MAVGCSLLVPVVAAALQVQHLADQARPVCGEGKIRIYVAWCQSANVVSVDYGGGGGGA